MNEKPLILHKQNLFPFKVNNEWKVLIEVKVQLLFVIVVVEVIYTRFFLFFVLCLFFYFGFLGFE